MKLKVCGLKYTSNIAALAMVQPDYMGFIFYPKSKRYVGLELATETLESIPNKIEKVAVFVNETLENILSICTKYGFKTIQLHGDETPDFAALLTNLGYTVIKAFSVDKDFDFKNTIPYRTFCSYFLFDTKGEGYGGTGHQFDWNLLNKYDQITPYFLSGGIDIQNVEAIKKMTNFNIHAIDINSKFELEPGLKDVEKVRLFKQKMDSE